MIKKCLFFLLSLTIILGGCRAPVPRPEVRFALGTICTVNLFDQGSRQLYSQIFVRIAELEGIFSANMPGSDLDRINQNAGLGPVNVSPELIEVLSSALEYAEKSGGYFDPSIGPLIKLWDIGGEREGRVPEDQEILAALALINFREIEINPQEQSVFLRRPGMALDLGAISKGYIADEVHALLARQGVERGIIDLGGDILVMGERSDGGYWRVGIQDPRGNRGAYIGIMDVKNTSVASSGVYERFFELDGRRYHHIFSTQSGFPAENGLLSVSVAADRSIDADALSTAAFALGWERGRALIDSVPGAQGLFVFDDLTVRMTEGLGEYFTLTDREYRLVW
ncbi:MAG: FAD:protein FMN transferase [Treponema sp.]|nr:FAD:protein FMN transferase [Treponema sp.]